MSGTSPATPCRSPFATALAPLHPSPMCTVVPRTTSPAPLPVAASSRTPIRRPAPKFYPNTSIEAIDPNVKYSSVYQFNFSVQRQLPYKISLTAAYVGTLGRHLQTFVDANYAPYSTVFGTPSTAAASTRPSVANTMRGAPGAPGTLTGITELISDQTSNYNALQISATKAMSHGFTVSGFYVWSRALESSNPVENGLMNAQDFGVLGKPFTPSNNSLGAIGGGLQEEYGPMDQNHDSNAAISGMWNIDYFHGSNRFVKEVVNGWQISPVALFDQRRRRLRCPRDPTRTLTARARAGLTRFLESTPSSTRTAAGFAPPTVLRRHGSTTQRSRPTGLACRAASALAARTATWDATP